MNEFIGTISNIENLKVILIIISGSLIYTICWLSSLEKRIKSLEDTRTLKNMMGRRQQ